MLRIGFRGLVAPAAIRRAGIALGRNYSVSAHGGGATRRPSSATFTSARLARRREYGARDHQCDTECRFGIGRRHDRSRNPSLCGGREAEPASCFQRMYRAFQADGGLRQHYESSPEVPKRSSPMLTAVRLHLHSMQRGPAKRWSVSRLRRSSESDHSTGFRSRKVFPRPAGTSIFAPSGCMASSARSAVRQHWRRPLLGAEAAHHVISNCCCNKYPQ